MQSKIRERPALLALTPLIAASPALGQGGADELAARIDRVVESYHDRGEFDGAVQVIHDGRVVYERGWGEADRTWDIGNESGTKFPICSLTKQFTAVLVLQLVGEGKVALDDTISDHLPWYRRDTGGRVTVEHLLRHTSGIPEPITEFDQLDDALLVAEDPRALIERFASGDLLFDPGTSFGYSNADYFILGAIIEAKDGAPFQRSLRDRVLAPLGMEDTGMRRFEAVVPGMATGYRIVDGEPEHRVGFGQLAYAAAGMYSTVEDLGKWNIGLLEHAVLSEELTEMMLTPIVLEGQTGSYVGLGSWVYARPLPPENERAPRLVERRGYIAPFTALNILCPDDGHAFTILSNTDPCDIHRLPYARGMPLDLLLLLYDEAPMGAGGRVTGSGRRRVVGRALGRDGAMPETLTRTARTPTRAHGCPRSARREARDARASTFAGAPRL